MTAQVLRNLHDARAKAVADLRTLAETAGSRAYTPDERRDDDRLTGEIADLDTRIENTLDEMTREEVASAASRRSPFNTPVPGEMTVERRDQILGDGFRAMTTTTTGLGPSVTPPEFAQTAWDYLAASAVAFESGIQVLSTDRDSLVLPVLDASGVAGTLAEGAPIPASETTGHPLTITPVKFGVYGQYSNEVRDDSNPAVAALYARDFLRKLALGIDKQIFEGDGTGTNLRGLRNVASIQLVNAGGTNGAVPANLDPFADALTALSAANADPDAAAVVMHPALWGVLSKIKSLSGGTMPVLIESVGSAGDGVKRSLYGRPVFLSSQISTADTQGTGTGLTSAYVYDVHQVVAVRRSAPKFETDSSSLFASDSTAVRALARVGLGVPNPAAVVRLTGFKLS